jgi:hypothetical protein
MNCANPQCGELVIRVHSETGGGEIAQTETWLACPRRGRRHVDLLVPEPYRRDYDEATAILDLSPRMSAVLARKIVGDLLANYENHTERRITQQIESFNGNTKHPRHIRENLHHLREIADFGAHTQVNERDEIIEASRDEAEWTLDLVDRLFEYLIVTPEKDRAMRETFDQKIADASRTAIPPLPDDPPRKGEDA